MKRPEAALQQAVVEYLSIQERLGKLMFFSCPNEGKRSFALAKAMKKAGLRSGVSDLCILVPDGVGFLEMKAGDNTAKPAQLAFMESARKFGAKCFVANTFEGAKLFIDALTKAYPARRAA